MTAPPRICPACHTPLPGEAYFCLHCGAPTPTGAEVGASEVSAPRARGEEARVRAALSERYRIERVLGEGGMATVYLAEDLKHRRRVAVKVMRPGLAASLGADRFLREIEIAAQLQHSHILPVHDSGDADGVLYYVMPFVEGRSLRERLERDGALPVDEALRLAGEVADALAYAHARGVIHRDIKPANILLGAGHALVADFGVARALRVGGVALTQTGLALGTPQYMSPEQAMGDVEVDARADVYAVGMVLYEMLAGEPAFTGPTPQAILARTLTEGARPLRAVRPGITQAVADVVSRATERNPDKRYASAADLAGALDAVKAGTGGTGAVAAVPPSGGKVWGVFAGAAVITLAVVYGFVARWGLPAWTLGLALVLLGVGATVLAVTGRVEARRRAGAALGPLAPWFTWRNATLGGTLAGLLWLGVVLLLVFRGPVVGAESGGARHLAVLPFENLGSADDAYMAEGIADQVRGKLTALDGLLITARSSSEEYRGTTESPQEIGRELGVDYLLGGTVRSAPGAGGTRRVQVTPELIDTHTGAATWQQTFDADLTDVFQVQETIAAQVASALGVALGEGERAELAARPTENLAAYEAFLRGESVSQGLIGSDPNLLRRSATFYEQAVDLDPGFGEAWARLAHVRALLFFASVPTRADAAAARHAADRAQELAPEAAETYQALSVVAEFVERDPALARRIAEQGLAAQPSSIDLMRRVASLQSTERPEEALGLLRRTTELDPRSVPSWGALASVLTDLHRPDETLDAARQGLEVDPANFRLLQLELMAFAQKGDRSGMEHILTTLPPDIDQAGLAAYLGTYNDMYWVLTDAQQRLLLTLPPSAFDNDRATWAAVRMQTCWLRGDTAQARAYADSARVAYEGWNAPDDPQFHQLYGVALAYLGRYDDAIREGRRGVELSATNVGNKAYGMHQLARVYLLAGKPELALDQLEPLLGMPYHLTPGWLTVDPDFVPLKGNPRFERLLAGG